MTIQTESLNTAALAEIAVNLKKEAAELNTRAQTQTSALDTCRLITRRETALSLAKRIGEWLDFSPRLSLREFADLIVGLRAEARHAARQAQETRTRDGLAAARWLTKEDILQVNAERLTQLIWEI